MTNIELYINKTLCDIQSPEKLGVRLNRVLINPSELNTKDAQYSYSITIPATPVNDAIFGYANVEEVKNKFNHLYTAQLYVDSVRIFDGQFKLSEIDSDGNYKGNLVVPAKKTIKEIFGDKKMTEIEGEWKLDVSNPLYPGAALNIVEMLNKYNTDRGIPDCIFPLVLYGLLPKVPKFPKDSNGDYSGKEVWDKTVRLGIEDFPPSINCMKTIEMIFKNHKGSNGKPYTVGGNAFNDARLTNLYMSYQNPTDYQQEWNWAHFGKFKITGSWTNFKQSDKGIKNYEHFFSKNDDGGKWNSYYMANLFRSSMIDKISVEDSGTNVFQFSTPEKKNDNDTDTVECKNISVTIPHSGLYKIRLDTTLKVRTNANNQSYGEHKYIGVENDFRGWESSIRKNNFENCRYEVKLLRDFGEGSFNIGDLKLDGILYRDNLPQDSDTKKTRYFPIPGSECVQMIDPLQNVNLVSGFRWGDYGRTNRNGYYFPDKDLTLAPNPLEKELSTPEQYKYCRIMAIKHGWSWDTKFSQKNKIYSAINSPGYNRILGTDPDLEETILPVGVDNSINLFNIVLNDARNSIEKIDNLTGKGSLNLIVWLEKGEHLTLVSVTTSGHDNDKEGWMIHDIDFTLEVEPFKAQPEWITVDNKGTGISEMEWNDPSDFKKDYINLIKFLPSGKKIDEWLDNFCKAFNLQLTQPEEGKFELNVKQSRPAASVSSLIDLDSKTSILQRTNEPLGLPSEFQVGFKINQDEEGYFKSKEKNGGIFEDGGGSFFTGNIDGQVVSQTSNFSYNWFKKIIKDVVVGQDGEGKDTMGTIELELPVITHKEIWDNNLVDYAEMVKKLYTDYSQRFWYRSQKQYDVGVVWDNENKKTGLLLPHLDYTLDGQNSLNLNYYDAPNSILSTYFTIIATDDSNYTYVECYLTPDEYEQLDGNKLVKLNGDLYYIASVEGYDPMGRNKTKLKLIRKI